MLFTETKLKGAFVVDAERREDNRGFFARTWCREEFAALGLSTEMAQCSVSFNIKRGTLRGMHYQAHPHQETKLVRCTQGAVYDVILDLRVDSATYRQWTALELTAENRRMVYVPAGVAHGFQTLTDDAELLYQMSETHHAESARGVRWNDPAFGIEWFIEPVNLSYKDASYSYCQKD